MSLPKFNLLVNGIFILVRGKKLGCIFCLKLFWLSPDVTNKLLVHRVSNIIHKFLMHFLLILLNE